MTMMVMVAIVTIIVVVRADPSEFGEGKVGCLQLYRNYLFCLKFFKNSWKSACGGGGCDNDDDDDDDNDVYGCGEGDAHFGVVGVGDCDDDDDGDASMYISVHHKIDFFLDVFLLTCSTIAPAYFTENAPAMIMAPNTTA